jgi:hypothetical protein
MNFFKILFTVICLYIFSTKLYATIYNLVNNRCDWVIYFADLITICSSVVLSLLLWKKINKIKYKIIWILLLSASIFVQTFVGLFSYLSKDPRINQIKVLWLFDMPNLLSILVMIFLLVLVMRKKQ